MSQAWKYTHGAGLPYDSEGIQYSSGTFEPGSTGWEAPQLFGAVHTSDKSRAIVRRSLTS